MKIIINRFKYFLILQIVLMTFFCSLLNAQDNDNTIPSPVKSILKTIIVDNYYPYTFVNSNGEPDGFSVDLAKAVATIMGMQLEIEVDRWETAKDALKNGQIDFLPMMAYSKERDTIFDFSVPHTIAYDAFFTRVDSRRISSVDELARKKIIVMKNDQAHDWLISNTKTIPEDYIFIQGIPEALRLLASGKGHVAIMPKLVGLIVLKDLNLTNINKNPSIIDGYNRPFSFAVLEGNLQLLEKFSQGLAIAKNSGQYDTIYAKWFGAIEPKEISFKSMLKYVLGVFAFLILGGSILALWSISLRKQVGLKTKDLKNEISERKLSEKRLKESEKKFRQLAENVREVFWIGSPDWNKIYYISPAYEEIWEQSSEKLYEDPLSWTESILEDDRDKVVSAIPESIENTDEIIFPEYRIRMPGGRIKWIQAKAYSVRDDQGKIYRMAGIAEDITKRKETEEALRFQALLLSEIQDHVTATDLEGRIVYVNQAECQSSKRTRDELLGESTQIFGEDPLRGATQKQILESSLKNGEWHGDVVNIAADGTELIMDLRTKLLKDESGKPWRLVGIATDVTERRQMEARLHQAQKMESIGNLAGGIAHDFNNLLFPIVGMSELLLEDLPEGSPEYESAKEIFNAGKRGSDLVKQILAFSRQSDHELIPTRIQKVLKNVIKLCRASIPSDVEILHDIQNDCGMIISDVTQLHQIAMNLITNAYHAIGESGGKIHVQVKETMIHEEDLQDLSLRPGKYAHLTVSDNGKGMAPEVISKIFEPYFTTKEKGKGTGLGLAVVHGLIKDHGGEISVYSEPGQGSTFNVYFPIMKKSENDEFVDPVEFLPRGSERILLVDDEEPIARLLTRILERLGYQVYAYNSSTDGLNAFKSNPESFDLVISDMTMPNMMGDQLAKNLLTIRNNIPIIICTGFSERINQEKAEAIGIKSFLMKPVIKSELAQTVRQVLDIIKSG